MKLFLWNQSINFIYPNEKNELMVPKHERKKIIISIRACPSWHRNFDSKMVRSEVILMKPKYQFIYPNKENALWCSIMKRKEIITWICTYLNWHMNFNSKKWWGKKFFGINSFVLMRRMSLWHPIINRKEILCESMFVQIDRRMLILKMTKSEAFYMKPKH